VDHKALGALVDWQISEGTSGLVVNGTTGESPTLTPAEQDANVKTVVAAAAGRVPVIAGVGTNDTARTVENARRVSKLGVSGLLVVTPYYNKPVQEGLYQHFAAVAKAVKTPMVVYNIPGRAGVALTADTMVRLLKFKNIVAIKDASGDLKFAQELRIKAGPRLAILSGEDMLNLPLASIGACGCISVVANVAPKMMSQMWLAIFEGDFAQAAGLHLELFCLHRDLFMETNPIPVKAALAMMGKIGAELRLPLTALPGDKAAKLKESLKRCGCLK